MLLPKFQHKSWRQHRVKDTIPLQNKLKFLNLFDEQDFFFGQCKKKYDREKPQFWKSQHVITGKMFILGKI